MAIRARNFVKPITHLPLIPVVPPVQPPVEEVPVKRKRALKYFMSFLK